MKTINQCPKCKRIYMLRILKCPNCNVGLEKSYVFVGNIG